MTTEKRLTEREKELACIYSICLLAADASNPDVFAEGIARALRAAMQREDSATCTVAFNHPTSGRKVNVQRGSSSQTQTDIPTIEAFLPEDTSSDGWTGSIKLQYRDLTMEFLPQEKALLKSVLIVAASMLRTSNLIETLKSTSTNLAAKNIALREVLSVIEDERRNALIHFRERLSADILPLAEQARNNLITEERRNAYLDLLIDELSRDVSALGSDPATHSALSAREREIAVQVRNGRTSKEIAELLGIAEATVERHRHNIRKKFKVANQQVNLASLLSNEHTCN